MSPDRSKILVVWGTLPLCYSFLKCSAHSTPVIIGMELSSIITEYDSIEWLTLSKAYFPLNALSIEENPKLWTKNSSATRLKGSSSTINARPFDVISLSCNSSNDFSYSWSWIIFLSLSSSCGRLEEIFSIFLKFYMSSILFPIDLLFKNLGLSDLSYRRR